jgi:2-amino-4-hydroxy-6-hydroxymethyldihydropteridine diphosphokinase
MARAAIALGSNLGDRRAALQGAVDQLAGHLAALTVSGFIDTAPEGDDGQPRFLNAAVVGDWGRGAPALLAVLMAIEQAFGRERPYPGAPRTLDLDLILFGSSILNEPGLTVPHPRFRQRGFVLAPLCQIAPDLVDPISGRSVAELYRRWQEAG